MKTHLARVRFARFIHENEMAAMENEIMAQRLRKQHSLTIIGICAGCFIILFGLASIPGLKQVLDTLPPIVQIAVPVIPLGAFGLWRLKKMTQP